MILLNLITLSLILIAIVTFSNFLRFCYHIRLINAFRSLIFSSITVLFATLTLLITLNINSYLSLTQTQKIATISFTKISKKKYKAVLKLIDGRNESYTLQGDQWMLSTQILKWQPIASSFLHLKTLYRLYRLSGHYNDIDQETYSHRSIYSLSSYQKLDLWKWIKHSPKWSNWLINACYGNAVFMPMGNKFKYNIFLGYDGLIAYKV
jgi:hypothetical protein